MPNPDLTFPFTRRAFLASAMLLPAFGRGALTPHCVRYDHVLGTSMELWTWADNARVSRAAEAAALTEIARLDAILSTYRPDSEISRLGERALGTGAPERKEILDLYARWRSLTGGAIDSRIDGRLNIDALGKAFVVDRVVAHVRQTLSGVHGIALNIGGDIAVSAPPFDIDVVDPVQPEDNATPLTRLRIGRGGVATSGGYARPGHLVDPRDVRRAIGKTASTVIASECVTANALATAACVLGAGQALNLAERVSGAEMLVVPSAGAALRTPGFHAFEVSQGTAGTPLRAWPAGFEVRIALTLRGGASSGGGGRRMARSPYVAIWVENSRGVPVRTVTVWGDKWRYLAELPDWWAIARNDAALNTTATRATRPAGSYTVAWNGQDDKGAALPPGTYKINLEVSREHGTYARRSATISCADVPAAATISESAEFAAVAITYGPRSAL